MRRKERKIKEVRVKKIEKRRIKKRGRREREGELGREIEDDREMKWKDRKERKKCVIIKGLKEGRL